MGREEEEIQKLRRGERNEGGERRVVSGNRGRKNKEIERKWE